MSTSHDSSGTPGSASRATHWWSKFNLGLIGWAVAALLLWWVLRSVSLSGVWAILGRLDGLQVATLVAVNLLIAFAFGWRWWVILRAQGIDIPYPILASYRLVCFSISYFTPGPHFGGEPLQVYLLNRRHGVPVADAAASVGLEKLIEVIVNFTFLLAGVAITLQARIAPEAVRDEAVILAVLLLAAPLGFLGALYAGKRPVSWLLTLLSGRFSLPGRWLTLTREAEDRAAQSCREHPRAILAALGGSTLMWCALLFEYWLSTHFLGLSLSFVQLVSVVTIARIAILLPSPGGLGTLEAGQVWVMGWLGLDPAAGLSLSLLIRARDILFGLTGLLWGAWLIGGRRLLWRGQTSE